MTLRLVYLPRPKPSWRLPSLAAAIAQTFSVQARSLVPTPANVSTTWWVKPSSAAVSSPIGLVTTLTLGQAGGRRLTGIVSSTSGGLRPGQRGVHGTGPEEPGHPRHRHRH